MSKKLFTFKPSIFALRQLPGGGRHEIIWTAIGLFFIIKVAHCTTGLILGQHKLLLSIAMEKLK